MFSAFFSASLGADIAVDTTIGNLVKTQHGSAGFSSSTLKTLFPYPHGHTAVGAGQLRILSGHTGALLAGKLHYAAVQTEYTALDTCTAGFTAGLYDTELEDSRIKLSKTEIRETKRLNRFYHAGFSLGIRPLNLRYSAAWYWGKPFFGLHDFGSFIGQPFLTFSAAVHTMRITKWYECSAGFFKLDGSLYNKAQECIASGAGRLIAVNNNVFIPVSEHSKLTVSAAYVYFSGSFAVRLTAKNQGYFFFPYRFYNRDISLTGSAIGAGSSYTYQKKRIAFTGTLLFYSLISSTGRDTLHAKEKKSVFFKGREIIADKSLPLLSGTHLLLFRFSFSYRFNHRTECTIGKTIPIPILPSRLSSNDSQQSQEQTPSDAAIFDPLLTGLSFRLTVRL